MIVLLVAVKFKVLMFKLLWRSLNPSIQTLLKPIFFLISDSVKAFKHAFLPKITCLLMGMFFSSFFLQLRGSNDGFSVVADYFGRGVFNKLTLVTDPPGSKSVGSLEVNLQRDLLINTKRNC